MYIMQQYRDTALAERWYNRLRALIQENLTAFPDKYSLYDVEPWSKTKRAAIAALIVLLHGSTSYNEHLAENAVKFSCSKV